MFLMARTKLQKRYDTIRNENKGNKKPAPDFKFSLNKKNFSSLKCETITYFQTVFEQMVCLH